MSLSAHREWSHIGMVHRGISPPPLDSQPIELGTLLQKCLIHVYTCCLGSSHWLCGPGGGLRAAVFIDRRIDDVQCILNFSIVGGLC